MLLLLYKKSLQALYTDLSKKNHFKLFLFLVLQLLMW
jgi:hypothetical protein